MFGFWGVCLFVCLVLVLVWVLEFAFKDRWGDSHQYVLECEVIGVENLSPDSSVLTELSILFSNKSCEHTPALLSLDYVVFSMVIVIFGQFTKGSQGRVLLTRRNCQHHGPAILWSAFLLFQWILTTFCDKLPYYINSPLQVRNLNLRILIRHSESHSWCGWEKWGSTPNLINAEFSSSPCYVLFIGTVVTVTSQVRNNWWQ